MMYKHLKLDVNKFYVLTAETTTFYYFLIPHSWIVQFNFLAIVK
jgi:hypothetical protein